MLFVKNDILGNDNKCLTGFKRNLGINEKTILNKIIEKLFCIVNMLDLDNRICSFARYNCLECFIIGLEWNWAVKEWIFGSIESRDGAAAGKVTKRKFCKCIVEC